MDAASLRLFQTSRFSGGAVALPPGLEAPFPVQTASYAADWQAPLKPQFTADSLRPVQRDVESHPRFCVHCGTKVSEKLLRMKNVKFCVHCGKQHPEHFMDAANSPVNDENLNEEVSDLICLKKKVETLKAVDMITQLIAMCDAQLATGTTQGYLRQQQVQGNGVLGEQCRQSANPWGQHAGSAYSYGSYSAWIAAHS